MKLSYRNLPLLLLHAREAAMMHFRPILKRFGMTDQQWRIVRVLSEAEDGLEPGQIAEACKIQKPSLTGILSRMAEVKLIERDRSEIDQRRQRISLSASGRALVDRMTPYIDRQYQRMEKMVGAEALSDICRTLDSMLGLLDRGSETMIDDGPPKRRRRTQRSAGGLSSSRGKRMRGSRKAKRLGRGDRRLQD
jgi:homoprotocatechuate degradation regulator HpaR